MDSEKLIKMANQIGDFFEANPNADQARMEIANHLKKFWNSVMIDSIVNHVKKEGGAGLHARVNEAIKQHLV